MTIEIRRAADIHRATGGWFDAAWHFSFSHYRDPDRLGIGPLRVVNDDRLVPGGVWPMHPHADVESLTYVVEGRFGHADSLGNGEDLQPGAAQVMTFGPHMAQHSERNLDGDRPLRFLQFWILPDRPNLDDAVQQHQFTREERTDRWLTMMSPHGEPGLDLHQDARVEVARLHGGGRLESVFAPGRGGYLLVLEGQVLVRSSAGEDTLREGDAVAITDMESLTVVGVDDASELWLAEVPLDFEPHGIWARTSA
ncbi:MAG: pirin family protein [Nitriliruptoraceae bacterium]|nr:pirin family protein [Nitriliruptoraceae bacterium]